ncbi:hypothetical protein [Saccharopolyspora sp. NPDC002376]
MPTHSAGVLVSVRISPRSRWEPVVAAVCTTNELHVDAVVRAALA